MTRPQALIAALERSLCGAGAGGAAGAGVGRPRGNAHLQATLASTWCNVMKEEIGLINQAGIKDRVRYWSGGNLYPSLLEAAACAGLDVNSDWKNPRTQTTDPLLIGVNPWRPAGGLSATGDVSTFARHDPNVDGSLRLTGEAFKRFIEQNFKSCKEGG